MVEALVIGLGVGVMGLLLDRLALMAEARRWIYWRRTPRHAATAVGSVMGELLETFQPTRHTLVEEQDRKRLDIRHPQDDAPGGTPEDVDLDRGRVVLHPHPRRP